MSKISCHCSAQTILVRVGLRTEVFADWLHLPQVMARRSNGPGHAQATALEDDEVVGRSRFLKVKDPFCWLNAREAVRA